MDLQQLDLFGNPIPIAQPKKGKPVQAVAPVTEQAVVPEATLEPEQLVVEETIFEQETLPEIGTIVATEPEIVVQEVMEIVPEFPDFVEKTLVETIDAKPVLESIIAAPMPEAILPPISQATEENVVYSNNNIVVKFKPKKVVIVEKTTADVLPETMQTTEPIDVEIMIAQAEVALGTTPPSTVIAANKTENVSKRGRKSYKELDAAIDMVEVPEDEILNKKLYYSITEVAGWFKVNNSQIRFWENEFDILKPRKNRKGDRLFRVEDVKNLQLIHYLLRNRKFSIEGAKAYLKANKNEANKDIQLVQSLTKFRAFLLELKANLTV